MNKPVRRPDLTIEQVKRMKIGLSQVLQELIMNFQLETGTHVNIEKEDRSLMGYPPCDCPFEIHVRGNF